MLVLGLVSRGHRLTPPLLLELHPKLSCRSQCLSSSSSNCLETGKLAVRDWLMLLKPVMACGSELITYILVIEVLLTVNWELS